MKHVIAALVVVSAVVALGCVYRCKGESEFSVRPVGADAGVEAGCGR